MFKDARRNRHIINGGIVPALNELGDPVCLLKYTSAKSYFHIYENIKDAPDTRVFSFYDTVVLVDVTEYAFVLLREVLIDYNGRIICVGKDWPDFARLFPDRDNIEFIHSWDNFPPDVMNGRVMYLKEFTSIMAGYKERCAEGFFSYDEIMTLVYFFSIRKSYGEEHAEKKFYLVDPVFPMEGLMSICDKVQLPYAYALANGFIPVIRLTHSDSSMYSDFEGDDIWDKFFDQPLGKEADEWKNSKNVWEFPFATITFSTRWLMQKIVDCEDISLVNTFLINKHVQQSVEEARKTVLPNPERAIGVLLRGTDYTTTRLPGHSIMASPEQVMEIIKEFEATGNYNTIYLSTEDEDILQRMKELCGDRLRCNLLSLIWAQIK